jgi:hypothetical protein
VQPVFGSRRRLAQVRRPGRRSSRYRRRRHVGVEAELVGADPDHIRTLEHAGALDPRAVDERPIRTGVHEHVPRLAQLDLCVSAGHVVARYNHIARRVPAEHERPGPHLVFATIGEADQPSTARARDHTGSRRGGGRELLEGGAVEEFRVADAGGIHDEQLVRTDLDLVPVQHWSRFVTLPDTVHQQLRTGISPADDGTSVRHSFYDGVPRLHPITGKREGAVRGSADSHFPGGDGIPLAGNFELHHAFGVRCMARSVNLPGGS